MLHDLRDDLGTDAFFDWLAQYVAAGDGRIATPDLFWSLLTPEQIEVTQATRDQYLRAPIVTEDGSESGF
jgi:aminopeptidase N